MKIKNTSSLLATVVLVLAGGLPITAAADKVVEMDMRFAGTLANNIEHFDPMNLTTVTSPLLHFQAKGRPGRAEGRVFGGRVTGPTFPTTCLGTGGQLFMFRIVEGPFVLTFKDLSLLFAKGAAGTICINTMTGVTEFESNIMFIGGRGKFEGATGQAVFSGEAESVSNDGSFSGITGTIVGWINVPGDDGDSDSDSDSD